MPPDWSPVLDDGDVNHIPPPAKTARCQQGLLPFLVAAWSHTLPPYAPTFFFPSAQVAWGRLCNRLLPWPGALTSRHITEAHVGGYLSGHFCTETETSQLLPHTRSLENISSLLPINYLEGDVLQLIAWGNSPNSQLAWRRCDCGGWKICVWTQKL